LDSPFFVFDAVLIVQWLAAYVGDTVRTKVRPLKGDESLDFDIMRTDALTLLGLIIGFSFAMAVSRYDQRRNLEQAEANEKSRSHQNQGEQVIWIERDRRDQSVQA